jgi:hypothetical protein
MACSRTPLPAAIMCSSSPLSLSDETAPSDSVSKISSCSISILRPQNLCHCDKKNYIWLREMQFFLLISHWYNWNMDVRFQICHAWKTVTASSPQTTNTRCSRPQKHDVGQFLYSKFLIVLWSTTATPTLPLTTSKVQAHDLHSGNAIKILNTWCHDHMTATWQFLHKNNLHRVNK